MSVEEWKLIFVAAFYGQKVVAGPLGGFVVITKHTSEMTVEEVAELQDFIYAWGAEKGVQWTEE